MTKLMILAVPSLIALLALEQASSDPEREAIRKAALDYCDGWYTGDAERMERALHPDLAKRVLMPDARTGQGRIEHMSAMTLVQYTRAGYGKKTPVSEQRREVRILDVFGNAASVRLDMHDWIDYLHLSKINGQWKIVNVLWELTPEAKKRRSVSEDPAD